MAATPPRTAFVTGATGFIGLNLVEHLCELGWDVVALHRPDSDLTYLRRFPVRLVAGTLADTGALERAVPEAVDVVFHTAADVTFWSRHRERQTRTNVDGTRHVVAAARKRRAGRLVHTSTTAVYGFATGFDERAVQQGRGSWFHYMHTKALAEEEVRRGIGEGLDGVILNPANVVGPYDRRNWARLILLAAAGRLPRVPPGRGSFAHVAEVVRAHVTAADRGRTGENYILGGADARYVDAVGVVAGLVGRPGRVRTAPAPLIALTARLLAGVARITNREPLITPEGAAFLSADLRSRSDKAMRELGYRSRPLSTMLEDCYRWLVAEGFLRPSRVG